MTFAAVERFWNDPGPDKGWSWVVLVCCWFFMAFTFGFSSMGATGVLFAEFIQVFDVSRETAMWPFSSIGIVQCFGASICGVLMTSEYVSIRTLMMTSSILGTLGLVLCFWAPNIVWTTVIFGLLFGSSISIAHTIVTVILCQFFRRYLATANGIVLSGIPVAGFFFPVFLEFLIQRFDLRGTMLITGGVISHLCIFALLLRPRTPNHFPSLTKSNSAKANETSIYVTSKPLEGTAGRKYSPLQKVEQSDYNSLETNCNSHQERCEDKHVKSCELQRNDSKSIDQKPNLETTGISQKNLNMKSLEICSTQKATTNDGKTRGFRNFVKLYTSILSQPIFYLVTLHAVMCVHVMMTISLTIIDFAMDKGIARSLAVIMSSVFAISDLIGKLFSGFIADRKWLTHRQLSAGVNFIIGGGLLALCFSNNTIVIFCIIVLTGVAEGSGSTLISILYKEYLGISRLALCLSLRIVITGVTLAIRPFIIGVFRDRMGSYTYYYYLLMGGAVLTGFLWVVEPIIARMSSGIQRPDAQV